ncbi:MAG: DUF4174 domain-containing protein [Terriglobus roseus]|nr:DUF4174 domain-containing protein [Terriglobus roseus]
MSMPAQNRSYTTLAALRDTARPLLIFAGPGDSRAQQQYAILSAHAANARERDMRVALLTTAPIRLQDGSRPPEASFSSGEQAHLRQRFHIAPGEFTVILVGKDGGEKLRSSDVIPWQKLASTIDSMPMRRDEMKQR